MARCASKPFASTFFRAVASASPDAQVSYTFGDGNMFNGLTLLLQATNLSNSPYRTYAGTKDRPLEYIEWGRTYLFGANYKF